MGQARSALNFCLSNLNKEDRLSVILISHEAVPFRKSLVAATEENVQAARAFVDGLNATGGTNLNDALLTGFDAAPELDCNCPYLIIFLTDGNPTIGVIDSDEILDQIAKRNKRRARLYVFGAGYDFNTRLLDLLAERTADRVTTSSPARTWSCGCPASFAKWPSRCWPTWI